MKNKNEKGQFTAFTDSLIGNKYGRLTVIDYAGKSKYGGRLWLCRCECGNEVVVQTAQLNNGRKKDCGCVGKKKFIENIIPLAHKANKKYKNNSDSRLYRCWRGMMIRCTDSKDKYFKDYGGRGIIVCKEWQDFDNFAEWALANGYNDVLTIDRIDVNGNYEPNNCRWIDNLTQQNNRTNNRLLTYNNETYSVAEWSRILDISRYALYARLKKGWSIERTLMTPLKQKKQ